MVNLTYLDAWENEITDITPLSNLTNLVHLNLSTNSIEDVSLLASLTELEELYLGSNKIQNIGPLTNLKKLKSLRLEDNEIRDLESWSHYIPAEGRHLVIFIQNNPLSEMSLSTYIPAMQDNGLAVMK